MRSPGDSPPGLSRVEVVFQVSTEELRSFLWPARAQFNVRRDPALDLSHQRDQVISGFSQPFLDVSCKVEQGNLVSARFQGIDADYPHNDALQFQLDSRDAEPTLSNENINADDTQLASFSFAHSLIERVYFFEAERFHVDQHAVGAGPTLATDATNLAQVLNFLQTSNPARFKKLVGLTKLVFPDVKEITVPPISDTKVRISLWSIPSESERQDLAIPLQESGTGVGQVLAVLYVALTSDYSQPILIDEPQSFLHPGAIRKLFDILRQEFDRHQYIVTTHSPIVVSSAQPGSLMLLRKFELESNLVSVDADQARDMRILLLQVGARLSDVFGADNVLWVEGRTEELCFPLIVTKLLNRALLGTQVIGVLNVGDLESKHKETIVRIYRKLSQGSALIPPAVGFIFDREARSGYELEDLRRWGKGKILFLRRRMYENYLLDSGAIASVISEFPECVEGEVTAGMVDKWLEDNGNDVAYVGSALENQPIDSEDWLSSVDAAKILNDMFLFLSDSRCEYVKVIHGLKLTEWLLENKPDALEEVAELINEAISADSDADEAA